MRSSPRRETFSASCEGMKRMREKSARRSTGGRLSGGSGCAAAGMGAPAAGERLAVLAPALGWAEARL